MIKTGLNS